ncbi:MAG TPA: protein-glutamine glutaminase family protein [Bacteriovoracaceae bacterium]|nr:protein-glutamine glutaminase family protein [Bacteriovoracaceae bacterium]
MSVYGLLFLGLCFNAFATSNMTSKIHEIDFGRKAGDQTLVLFTNGKFAKLPPMEKTLLEQLKEAKENNDNVEVTLDQNRFITAAYASADLTALGSQAFPSSNKKSLDQVYAPSTIPDLQTAQEYFDEARENPKDSQCFNRAMVWSYEWWKKHSLRSNKLLVFFSRQYMRKHPDFEWWFHIAPAVHVLHDGKVVERVMDVKYNHGPRTHPEWTATFMRGDLKHVACPYITKFSQYADYPYTGNCYLMRTSMYTWQPADLQMNEAWGFSKSDFNLDDVRAAYLEAFDEQH